MLRPKQCGITGAPRRLPTVIVFDDVDAHLNALVTDEYERACDMSLRTSSWTFWQSLQRNSSPSPSARTIRMPSKQWRC